MQRFDTGVSELETIVKKLEAGDLPLEEALAAFESGIALVRLLSERLSQAETQIELLTRGSDGTLQRQPIDAEDSDR
jgi:exodeoxyribonuclease VII small subunit